TFSDRTRPYERSTRSGSSRGTLPQGYDGGSHIQIRIPQSGSSPAHAEEKRRGAAASREGARNRSEFRFSEEAPRVDRSCDSAAIGPQLEAVETGRGPTASRLAPKHRQGLPKLGDHNGVLRHFGV